MSSSITESLVPEGKLLVHVAENGHSFELECNENTSVEAVMRLIESDAGVNFNDQLLLCMDMKLEPLKLLSAYSLPADDKEVFLFNKMRLHRNSPPSPPEQVDDLQIAEPLPPVLSQDLHPLDKASDPALKALPSYERQFMYHYDIGNAIHIRTLSKFAICERLLVKQKVQERAVEVGRGNLEQYYIVINQNYNEFMKHYSRQHKIHSDLLANFGRDIEKLRSVKLHPSLQTSTRQCLLDFVKEENLPKSAESCSSSHRNFEKKVLEFKQKFDNVKYRVEELLNISLPLKSLEVKIKEHQRLVSEQKSIMQSLSKDVDTVKKLVDDCLSCQLSSSLRPHDAVSALGPMYDVHDKNHLPRMRDCDHSISKLLDFCKDKKNEMNNFVHSYMQKITSVSYFIKDVKLQFPVFREAMVRQDDLFSELKLVRGIVPAYGACLAEVVRRKASMKLYMGMAGQLAEKLATKREVELRRREEFLKANRAYIPRHILSSMGLYDIPSQCDVNIAPFDTNLLEIDISDLENYTPEYLAGLCSKGGRGLFSISSASSHSSEAEDFAVDTFDKDDNEELLEGCELVDIAGTSKMEVENAKLKAELASAIALICSLCREMEYESLDDSKPECVLKNATEKTAEALHLKDEYGKHLQSMVKAKQMQCISYERRIQELEQRLSDQYLQEKHSKGKDVLDFALLAEKTDDCTPEASRCGVTHMPCISTSEPMDEVSCVSNAFDAKLGLLNTQPSKGREGVDENMVDSSGMLNPQLDSSMVDPHCEQLPVSDKDCKDKMMGQSGMSMTNSFTAESMPEPLKVLSCDAAADLGLQPKILLDLVSELQSTLIDKSNQMCETETKLKAAMEEIAMLGRELEMGRKLLDESQMNCAHLENCLHEAREEAQTNLCAADRRATEYNALRASAVKMRGLFERFRSCVHESGGVAGFAETMHALAQSLANSSNENEDDGTAEFWKCIQVLADRVGFLSGHREELLDKYRKFEAANELLRKEVAEKRELVKTLSKKHQLEKQANKEKISFGRLEVHEIAAFILNAAGHYEAINRNCLNYYLSAESVALFTDNLPSPPIYIVGQIVHIEHQTAKPLPSTSTRPEHGKADQTDQHHLTTDLGTDRMTLNSGLMTSNPYGLPIGCEYFVVTVAMLPVTSIHSPPPS